MLNHLSTSRLIKYGGLLFIFVVLGISFGVSNEWLTLCYGLALFLFGMQCIEEGLNNAAGSTLERLMSKSTATPVRGMLFGMVATFILQSTTLVSLLTIAFLGTGLVSLAGGIAIILGTNLGATSGIWLLALLGKSISLSPVSIPLFVFGIIASFFKGRIKSIGRVFIGISLIFLGIDTLKEGFDALGNQVDFTSYQLDGLMNIVVFTLIGLLLTIVLQSTHATLILTLAALAGGQISVEQSFALAIGSNVGSSLSTALVGMLGSARSGQRLALAHLIFNVVTATLSLILWMPLTDFTKWVGDTLGLNHLLQLALFHTLFNALGVIIFWRYQEKLASLLCKWLPNKPKKNLLLEDEALVSDQVEPSVKAHYLNDNMLLSGDTAMRAMFYETRHLIEVCLEVLCHAAYVPIQQLYAKEDDSTLLPPQPPLKLDAKSLYEEEIKSLFSEILSFNSRMNVTSPEVKNQLFQLYLVGSYGLDAVKEGKGVQKTMYSALSDSQAVLYQPLLTLRQHLFMSLRYFVRLSFMPVHSSEWDESFTFLQHHVQEFAMCIQNEYLDQLREKVIEQADFKILVNESHHIRRVDQKLLDILMLSKKHLPEGVTLFSNKQEESMVA
ncbi:Na/Pi cotransporter family protein [Pelistega sp. NLN82]|uniref:Na/Pi cotransporter family protein n=1 Tax=Pelistega ratti TaxID=2652177 RepID=A0A6L9Y8X1_9BURK|nr:Na/Pi symporter [Pelistega ratti]NEN76184.1 Na/Pi cotransporter family protein [Pelistega ratti]